MATLFAYIPVILQASEPGRGENPSGPGGFVIIAGIALLLLLVAIAARVLLPRLVKKRREADTSGATADAPLPSEEGRRWSSER